MAGQIPQRQPSASSSRHSVERPISLRYSNPDIFSDDFALEPLGVADGFRPPGSNHDDIPRPRSPSPRIHRRTSAGNQPKPDRTKDSPRRNEGPQTFGRVNSFALRYDAPSSRLPRRTPSVASTSDTSDAAAYGPRPMSTISTPTVLRAQSPYQGATGPSHPYAMYPQHIARSSSVTTNSTIRIPERPYFGSNGPTHPYGMYLQGTVPEGEVSPLEETTPQIPVGFPGLGQHYRRRLGPDGEDADDIVGPDGHTEQLPPYTQYPDEISPKAQSPAPSPVVDNANLPRTIHVGRSNTSTVDLLTPRDRTVQADGPDEAVREQVDELHGSIREKWSRKGKRRLCHGRLPVWSIILIVVLLVTLGAVLGGVIGRSVGRRHAKNSTSSSLPDPDLESLTAVPASTVFATVTATLVDASPLASIPPDLPKLPVGSFGVPLGNLVISSSSCLTEADQENAWGCSSRSYLGLDIIPSDYGPTLVNLTSGFSPNAPLRYGPQPPQLNSLSSVSLMSDTDDPGRGPAYFFQQAYDKIVILKGSQLSASPSKRSLDEEITSVRVEERQAPYGRRYRPVLRGDKPWFCFWNNTILEGFIYVKVDSTIEWPNASAIVSSLLESPAPSVGSFPDPNADPSSALVPTETSVSVPTPSFATDAYNPGYPSPTPTSGYAKRAASQPTSHPSPYPKLVKIEERRLLENPVSPYCQMMQVLDNGLLGQVPNENGDPVIVHLTEDEPEIAYTGSNSGSRRRRRWFEDSNRAAPYLDHHFNMPCFKGLAVSIHTSDGPLPEYSIQKQGRASRITSYIPVPPAKVPISSVTNKLEQSTFAISITLLTPGLNVPYSTPKPTPQDPYPRPQIVGGLPGISGDRGRYTSVIGPYLPLTASSNETIAAYIYFDGRQKEEVATLLRRGEETWVNSRWVSVPEAEGGGLAEREFLFREVGLERWLNGLDLEGKDAAAQIERRRQRMEKKRRKKREAIGSDDDADALHWPGRERLDKGVLRYGADERSPLEILSDEDEMFSSDPDSDDDPIPEATGQIKVALFRVLASGEIKKGEYSPQFDAHDDDEDSKATANGNKSNGDAGEAEIDHTTSFAKPKSLDPKSISTQTVTGIDGPEKPYAVFTFLYRGEKQLQKMGILKPPKSTDKATSSTAKRKSIQNTIENLKPLKPGGALGFSTFRDTDARPNKSYSSKKMSAYENAMESDEEEGDDADKTAKLVNADGEEFKNSMLSPEDVRRQGELAEGVKKIK
ncbi:MAG: hypothetical protein Q9187_006062, partial [Circinaria calcarea]